MPLYSSIYGQEEPTFYSQVLGQPQPSRRPGLFEGLFMSGAGLMGGRDWSEGMTQGMKGFGQGLEMGQNKASRDMTNQVQMAQVQNSFMKHQLDRQQEAQKQQAQDRLSQFVQSGGDVNSPEGKALLFGAGMGEQAVTLSKPQAPVNPNLVSVVGPDGKPVLKPAAEAVGMTPYKEPPARNTQTETFADGIYVINPDGTRGNKLGDAPPKSSNDGEQWHIETGPDGTQVQVSNRGRRMAMPGATIPEWKTVTNPDGSTYLQNTKTGDKKEDAANKPPTAEQAKSALFSKRMADAEQVFGALEKQGWSPTAGQEYVGAIPLLGNKLLSGERQQFEQAERNFINAVLRPESGAVISDVEFANARRQYIPQPGDTPATLAQKKANRQQAMLGVGAGSGNKLNAPKVAGAAKVKDKYGLE